MTDPRDWWVRAIDGGNVLRLLLGVLLVGIGVLIAVLVLAAQVHSDECVPFVIQRSQDVMITNNYSQCASVVVIDHARRITITGNYYRTGVK